MFITQVSVPKFRVLQNINIEFEQDFPRSVFPIGSLNGGGKSTLLQLIFILLHCSPNRQHDQYVENLLEQDVVLRKQIFEIPENSQIIEEKVATIELDLNGETASLEFLIVNNMFMGDDLDLGILEKLEKSKKELNSKKNKLDIELLKRSWIELEDRIDSKGSFESLGFTEVRKLVDIAQKIGEEDSLPSSFRWVYRYRGRGVGKERLPEAIADFETTFEEVGVKFSNFVKEISREEKFISNFLEKEQTIYKNLKESNLLLLSRLGKNCSLVCKTKIDIKKFKEISQKVSLCASSTQIFLFLERTRLNNLFNRSSPSEIAAHFEYFCGALSEIKNLYVYDFSLVNQITSAFQKASQKDRERAISLGTGEYGNSLAKLMSDLKSFFNDKDVTVSPELDRVIFKKQDSDTELAPEDLSHGELKRIGIYTWLKYSQVEDSVVLMDEIETGFHPDWQHEIVSELQNWSSGNQFILATHSYDVCEAVTPAHVKTLDPVLKRH
jgi:predicted ATP-binding protein involved in virulence